MVTLKKEYIALGGLIFVIALIFIVPTYTASVLSVSENVELGTDGKAYTILQLRVENSDLATYRLKSPNGYIFDDGTTLNDGQDILLSVKPSPQYCNYNLYPRQVTIAGFVIDNYYELGNPTRKQTLTFSTDKSSNTLSLSAFTPQSGNLLASDGKGVMAVESQGAFQGGQDCPQGDYVAIIKDGKPIVVSESNFEKRRNLVSCLDLNFVQCLVSYNDLVTGEFERSDTDFVEFADIVNGVVFDNPSNPSAVRVYPRASSFSQPVVTIKTDEDFFNLVRVSPSAALVKPQILSFTDNGIYENQKGNYRLIVKNPSDVTKTFTGTIYVNKGSISPLSFQVSNIPAGGQGQVTFIYQAPSTSATEKDGIRFDYEVCDKWDIFSECSSGYERIDLINEDPVVVPDPDKGYCGDGICQSTEDYGICSKDCDAPVTPPQDCSDIPNSQWNNNLARCVCNNGYQTQYDQSNGNLQCTIPSLFSDEELIALGILILAVLGTGYVFISRKGEAKSRRRKK